MLNHFFQFLGKQKPEFKDLKASQINTKDVTTKAIYDVLRAKIDSRKRKPKGSPKPETSYLEYTPYEHDQTFQKRPRGHGEDGVYYTPIEQQEYKPPAPQLVTNPPQQAQSIPSQAMKAPKNQAGVTAGEQDQTISEHSDSSEDEEEGEAEMEENTAPQIPFKKLRTSIAKQLSMLNEDQVTYISFDWHANEGYLKVSYNIADPIE